MSWYMNPAWPLLYLATPLLAVLTAIWRAGELRDLGAYLIALPALMLFEFSATLTATAKSLLRPPLRWDR